MAQQAAVSGNAYKNKGMTIVKAGAITASSPVTQDLTLRENTTLPLSYGSKVSLSSGAAYSSGNLGTYNAKTTFAYKQVSGRYIMKKYTSHVNGTADTLMSSCASSSSERMRSIPYIEFARSLGSGVSTSWNYVTGAITKGTGAGESRSFGNDEAARPTNATPGELQYKTSAKLPVADEYAPKTAP